MRKIDAVKQFNFVTECWEPICVRTDDDGPSSEWVQGWDACMHSGSDINPFDPFTQEAIDWQDGWDCAEKD